jgi:hypothetical protein
METKAQTEVATRGQVFFNSLDAAPAPIDADIEVRGGRVLLLELIFVQGRGNVIEAKSDASNGSSKHQQAWAASACVASGVSLKKMEKDSIWVSSSWFFTYKSGRGRMAAPPVVCLLAWSMFEERSGLEDSR